MAGVEEREKDGQDNRMGRISDPVHPVILSHLLSSLLFADRAPDSSLRASASTLALQFRDLLSHNFL